MGFAEGTGEGTSGRAVEGKFGFGETSNMQGFNRQIYFELEKHGITLEHFNESNLKPISALTDEEVTMMKEIRDAVPPITKDTLLQKAIPPSDINSYLSGDIRK